VVPIAIVIGYSLFDNVVVEKQPTFVGLANYLRLLSTPDFWTAVGNTVVYTITTVALHLLLGLAFALMLTSKLVGRVPTAILRAVYVLPWIFTASVVAVVWRLLLDLNGVLNWLLLTIGIIQEAVPWLATSETAFAAVVLISVWAGYPIFMISLLAGLQSIPGELHEAAMMDGAGPIRRFWNVTLPGLRPVIASMTLLDVLWTTQQFTLIWATTGGGPILTTEMLSTYTYRFAFGSYQFSLASTSAVIVLLVSLIIAVFYVRQQRASIR
jgi:multiple sugar transport system permease protein